MKTIFLKRCNNGDHNVIVAYFSYDQWLFQEFIEHSLGIWSPVLRGFVLKDDPSTPKQVHTVFAGKAFVDASRLTPEKKRERPPSLPRLSMDKQYELNNFRDWMVQRRYSPNTVKSYVDCLGYFFRFYDSHPIDELTSNDIVRFNQEYILKYDYSQSFQNQVINAIKLFYSLRGRHNMVIEDIQRPFGVKKLPVILSLEEVERLLSSISNVKHRTILMLIYSCGLRRSELLNMCIADIDSDRMIIHIKGGKGKKDRVVPLAEKMLIQLRAYYKCYHPKHYLFTGEDGLQYSPTSLQHIFRRALYRSRITKSATLHTLRHSYATHLLESGVNLRYIQEILGHRSSKTTEIYTHVSSDETRKVRSPLDGLNI